MTEAEMKAVMDRVWRDLPESGPLSTEDRKKLWEAIENLVPHLPGDSRSADNTNEKHD